MPTEQSDGQTDRWTDGHQTVTLRFPLDVASLIIRHHLTVGIQSLPFLMSWSSCIRTGPTVGDLRTLCSAMCMQSDLSKKFDCPLTFSGYKFLRSLHSNKMAGAVYSEGWIVAFGTPRSHLLTVLTLIACQSRDTLTNSSAVALWNRMGKSVSCTSKEKFCSPNYDIDASTFNRPHSRIQDA